jgi:hypothetical protein
MYSVIRQYSGENASRLFDELEANASEVEGIIGEVEGFISYTLIRTPEGGVSVTVCKDKAGTDESSRRAAQWVQDRVPVNVTPPTVLQGSVIMHRSR